MEFQGKVAIVTGGSRGIGKAYALALAAEGASVVVAARTEKEATAAQKSTGRGDRHVQGLLPGSIHQTASEIVALGAQALPVRCDVTSEEQVRAMVAKTMERFGRIDVLVNNAAIYPRYKALEITQEQLEQSFRVNTLGQYLCAKHVLPVMIKQSSGAVINLTARTAETTVQGWSPGQDLMAYAITKAGVNRMTTYLAQEMSKHHAAVNALVPGMIKTQGLEDALPEDFDYSDDRVSWHLPTPERLGPALLFLAQQTAESFTGKIVHTDEFRKTWP